MPCLFGTGAGIVAEVERERARKSSSEVGRGIRAAGTGITSGGGSVGRENARSDNEWCTLSCSLGNESLMSRDSIGDRVLCFGVSFSFRRLEGRPGDSTGFVLGFGVLLDRAVTGLHKMGELKYPSDLGEVANGWQAGMMALAD
jgi:hypothetical protein